MGQGGIEQDEAPIGELVGQLIDDGKAYVQAEFQLAKANAETTVLARLNAAKKPAVLGAGALLFLLAGVVVLCMTLALALATLIGPLAGGLIATLVALSVAAMLGLAAKKAFEKTQ